MYQKPQRDKRYQFRQYQNLSAMALQNDLNKASVNHNDDDDGQLPESEMGTKEYWEACYQAELQNFQDHGDTGDIWFGESTMQRICKWIGKQNTIDKDDPILDAGCGNGMMLVELAKDGFTNLWGVDYVSEAVRLASEVCAQENVHVNIQVGDIISNMESIEQSSCLKRQYKVIIDKGTYDAISLCPDNALAQRTKYVQNIGQLLMPGGYFIITSCNWTETEILTHFNRGLEVCHHIPAPTFQFGGKTGNQVTTLVFRKI